MSEGRLSSAPPYAGDISPREAWRILNEDRRARLIDVRTRAEWNFVGLPDLGAVGTQALLAEWQVFPTMAVNGTFADEAAGLISESGGAADAPVFLLRRSSCCAGRASGRARRRSLSRRAALRQPTILRAVLRATTMRTGIAGS